MQFLCQETDCLELFRICKYFAVEQKALCYFKTELGKVKSYYAYLLQRNTVLCNFNNTLYFMKLVCFAMRNGNEMLNDMVCNTLQRDTVKYFKLLGPVFANKLT